MLWILIYEEKKQSVLKFDENMKRKYFNILLSESKKMMTLVLRQGFTHKIGLFQDGPERD